MKIPKSYLLYIVAAIVTIIGIVTGWYFFILLVLPLGIFNSKSKE